MKAAVNTLDAALASASDQSGLVNAMKTLLSRQHGSTSSATYQSLCDLSVLPILKSLVETYLAQLDGAVPVRSRQDLVPAPAPCADPVAVSAGIGAGLFVSDEAAVDALWCLVSMSGDAPMNRLLVRHGFVPLAVKLLQRPSCCRGARENALWLLGAVASEAGGAAREELVRHHALELTLAHVALELAELSYYPFARAAGGTGHATRKRRESSPMQSASAAASSVVNTTASVSSGAGVSSGDCAVPAAGVPAVPAAQPLLHGPRGGPSPFPAAPTPMSTYSSGLLRVAAWALLGMTEHSLRIGLPLDLLLPPLSALLDCPDPEVAAFACWALCHVCDGPGDHIYAVLCNLTARELPQPQRAFSLLPDVGVQALAREAVGVWCLGWFAPREDRAVVNLPRPDGSPASLAAGTEMQRRYSCPRVSNPENEGFLGLDVAEEGEGGSAAATADAPSVAVSCATTVTEATATLSGSSSWLPSTACKLLRLLKHEATRVAKPALRAVGNVVCAEDDRDFTAAVVTLGALPYLTRLTEHPSREVAKEACWTLSNVAAGSPAQIQAVLESGCLRRVLRLCADAGGDSGVRTEACWVLLNALTCGSEGQLEVLVRAGAVRALCALLSDPGMLSVAVDGLDKVLQVGERLSAAAASRMVVRAMPSMPREFGASADATGLEAFCPRCSQGRAATGPSVATLLHVALPGLTASPLFGGSGGSSASGVGLAVVPGDRPSASRGGKSSRAKTKGNAGRHLGKHAGGKASASSAAPVSGASLGVPPSREGVQARLPALVQSSAGRPPAIGFPLPAAHPFATAACSFAAAAETAAPACCSCGRETKIAASAQPAASALRAPSLPDSTQGLAPPLPPAAAAAASLVSGVALPGVSLPLSHPCCEEVLLAEARVLLDTCRRELLAGGGHGGAASGSTFAGASSCHRMGALPAAGGGVGQQSSRPPAGKGKGAKGDSRVAGGEGEKISGSGKPSTAVAVTSATAATFDSGGGFGGGGSNSALRGDAAYKRAARLWSVHFDECGLCRRTYARAAAATAFCAECRVPVCVACDCSAFHLSAQLRLLELEEEVGKEADPAHGEGAAGGLSNSAAGAASSGRAARKKAARAAARAARAAGSEEPFAALAEARTGAGRRASASSTLAEVPDCPAKTTLVGPLGMPRSPASSAAPDAAGKSEHGAAESGASGQIAPDIAPVIAAAASAVACAAASAVAAPAPVPPLVAVDPDRGCAGGLGPCASPAAVDGAIARAPAGAQTGAAATRIPPAGPVAISRRAMRKLRPGGSADSAAFAGSLGACAVSESVAAAPAAAAPEVIGPAADAPRPDGAAVTSTPGRARAGKGAAAAGAGGHGTVAVSVSQAQARGSPGRKLLPPAAAAFSPSESEGDGEGTWQTVGAPASSLASAAPCPVVPPPASRRLLHPQQHAGPAATGRLARQQLGRSGSGTQAIARAVTSSTAPKALPTPGGLVAGGVASVGRKAEEGTSPPAAAWTSKPAAPITAPGATPAVAGAGVELTAAAGSAAAVGACLPIKAPHTPARSGKAHRAAASTVDAAGSVGGSGAAPAAALAAATASFAAAAQQAQRTPRTPALPRPQPQPQQRQRGSASASGCQASAAGPSHTTAPATATAAVLGSAVVGSSAPAGVAGLGRPLAPTSPGPSYAGTFPPRAHSLQQPLSAVASATAPATCVGGSSSAGEPAAVPLLKAHGLSDGRTVVPAAAVAAAACVERDAGSSSHAAAPLPVSSGAPPARPDRLPSSPAAVPGVPGAPQHAPAAAPAAAASAAAAAAQAVLASLPPPFNTNPFIAAALQAAASATGQHSPQHLLATVAAAAAAASGAAGGSAGVGGGGAMAALAGMAGMQQLGLQGGSRPTGVGAGFAHAAAGAQSVGRGGHRDRNPSVASLGEAASPTPASGAGSASAAAAGRSFGELLPAEVRAKLGLGAAAPVPGFGGQGAAAIGSAVSTAQPAATSGVGTPLGSAPPKSQHQPQSAVGAAQAGRRSRVHSMDGAGEAGAGASSGGGVSSMLHGCGGSAVKQSRPQQRSRAASSIEASAAAPGPAARVAPVAAGGSDGRGGVPAGLPSMMEAMAQLAKTFALLQAGPAQPAHPAPAAAPLPLERGAARSRHASAGSAREALAEAADAGIAAARVPSQAVLLPGVHMPASSAAAAGGAGLAGGCSQRQRSVSHGLPPRFDDVAPGGPAASESSVAAAGGLCTHGSAAGANRRISLAALAAAGELSDSDSEEGAGGGERQGATMRSEADAWAGVRNSTPAGAGGAAPSPLPGLGAGEGAAAHAATHASPYLWGPQGLGASQLRASPGTPLRPSQGSQALGFPALSSARSATPGPDASALPSHSAHAAATLAPPFAADISLALDFPGLMPLGGAPVSHAISAGSGAGGIVSPGVHRRVSVHPVMEQHLQSDQRASALLPAAAPLVLGLAPRQLPGAGVSLCLPASLGAAPPAASGGTTGSLLLSNPRFGQPRSISLGDPSELARMHALQAASGVPFLRPATSQGAAGGDSSGCSGSEPSVGSFLATPPPGLGALARPPLPRTLTVPAQEYRATLSGRGSFPLGTPLAEPADSAVSPERQVLPHATRASFLQPASPLLAALAAPSRAEVSPHDFLGSVGRSGGSRGGNALDAEAGALAPEMGELSLGLQAVGAAAGSQDGDGGDGGDLLDLDSVARMALQTASEDW